MGSQPRAKTPKRAIHAYKKSFRQKGIVGKRSNRHATNQDWEEKTAPTEQEIFEATIKRLHTLGSQKFGSSPFSEHFDRWLHTVESVLCEFESQPEVRADEQFVKEKNHAIASIKLQLDNRRKREAHLEQQVNNLSDAKNRLQQVNNEYLTKAIALKGQKNTAIKRLNKEITTLKKEQDRIINLKTGFFRGLSKKEREQKELEAVEKLSEKQQELEIVFLEFKDREKRVREEFDHKREPVVEDVKVFQKRVKQLDEDSSLEERWFTCEALIDAVNGFWQRKATEPLSSSEA